MECLTKLLMLFDMIAKKNNNILRYFKQRWSSNDQENISLTEELPRKPKENKKLRRKTFTPPLKSLEINESSDQNKRLEYEEVSCFRKVQVFLSTRSALKGFTKLNTKGKIKDLRGFA